MPPPPRPWRATQPLKALCITYFFLTTPPYVALLLLKYSLRSLRPSPELGIKANITNAVFKGVFRLITSTRTPNLLAEKLPADKDRSSKVPVPSAMLFVGPIAATTSVRPAPRNAIWFPDALPPPPPPPAASSNGGGGGVDDGDGGGSRSSVKSDTVVLHFPGGAFVVQLGHEMSGRKCADALLAHTAADRVVWAQYRLASTPGDAFPAAVQDAVTFYAYILSLGFQPQNVIVSGDSAGANLALALLRYLESERVLPLPRGILAWSPWVEVTPRAALDYDESSGAVPDLLTGEFLQWGSDAYRPGGVVSDEAEAYISPLHHPFRTSVPLFVHAGEAEAFCSSVKEFSEEMAALNGSKVRYHGTPHATHDLILCWELWGMRDEVAAAVGDAWDLLYP